MINTNWIIKNCNSIWSQQYSSYTFQHFQLSIDGWELDFHIVARVKLLISHALTPMSNAHAAKPPFWILGPLGLGLIWALTTTNLVLTILVYFTTFQSHHRISTTCSIWMNNNLYKVQYEWTDLMISKEFNCSLWNKNKSTVFQ